MTQLVFIKHIRFQNWLLLHVLCHKVNFGILKFWIQRFLKMCPVVQRSTGKKLFDTQKQAPTGAQAAKYVCLNLKVHRKMVPSTS